MNRYWNAVFVGSIALVVAWFLPFGTLRDTGYIGGGNDQVVRDFSATVWFWDLIPATLPLLVAGLVIVGAAWLGRRDPDSLGPVAVIFVVALVANTYLAASVADRAWRDVATPGAAADLHPMPRCEFSGHGRSYTPADGSMERLPTFDCVLGLEDPMLELHEKVIAADYTVGGLAGFSTGIGTHLMISISFLIALASAWTLVRRRMSRLKAGLTVAAGVALIYVIAFFDSISHLS